MVTHEPRTAAHASKGISAEETAAPPDGESAARGLDDELAAKRLIERSPRLARDDADRHRGP